MQQRGAVLAPPVVAGTGGQGLVGGGAPGRRDDAREADGGRPQAASRTTTVLIVRHAETDGPVGDDDPGLNADGRARAEELGPLAREIRVRFAGRTVGVVGHATPIPALVAELGGPPETTIADQADVLLAVTRPRFQRAAVVRLRYGRAA
jgi:broad specificity phosphatase PhoE